MKRILERSSGAAAKVGRPALGRGLIFISVLVLSACSGCSDGAPPTAPPDRTSPMMEVVFPADGAYDRDGDGLLDLEIAFSDSASGVDVESIVVTSVRGIRGMATSGTNLMDVWRVERADPTGLHLEETVDNLLLRGEAQLQVRVKDREGNGSLVGVNVVLPPAALYKVIDLRSPMVHNTSALQIGPSGEKAYVSIDRGIFVGSSVAIIDLATLEWERTVQSPISALSEMALDGARGLIYLASIDWPQVGVFDLASQTFLPPIATTNRGIGITYSASRDELYMALEVDGPRNGFISVIDVAAGRERTVWDLGVDVGQQLAILSLLLDSEATLYAGTTAKSEGILVIDPDTGELLDQIDLAPERSTSKGIAFDLEIDGATMLASGFSPDGTGRVAVFPVGDPSAMRFALYPRFSGPFAIDVAPGGAEYGVTTGDRGVGFFTTTLLDAASLEVTWADTTDVRPHDLAFRPDGNVFLVTQERERQSDTEADLWVYLRR